MRSLFVLGLPRTLSSLVWRASVGALGLRTPRWTDHGEILNLDRHVLYGGPAVDESIKFVRPGQAPAIFERAVALLDDVARPEGWAYKDVVQPFVIAAWPGLARFAVLIVERPLADVATAVLDRGWRYPGHAVDRAAPDDDAVIEGLLRAEQALATVPGERVCYDDLIRDEGALQDALARLYPELDVPWPVYIDAGFRAVRTRVLSRRRAPAYSATQARIDAIRARLGAPDPTGGARP